MVFTKKTSNVFFKLSVWKDRMDETFNALIMNVFLIKRVILLTVNMMDTLHAPKGISFADEDLSYMMHHMCTCLLCCSQTVLRSAQNATDQAELVYSELCCFRDFFFFQQAADGKTPAVSAGSGQRLTKWEGENQQWKEIKQKETEGSWLVRFFLHFDLSDNKTVFHITAVDISVNLYFFLWLAKIIIIMIIIVY